MPCGHVISVESMTMLLRNIIDSSKYIIRCPAAKENGTPCEVEWTYSLCKKVGVLT